MPYEGLNQRIRNPFGRFQCTCGERFRIIEGYVGPQSDAGVNDNEEFMLHL